MKLNLGSGKGRIEGFTNLDIVPGDNIDIVADVSEGIPLENNSVEEVYCRHVLQYVDNLENAMEEIYRICKNEANIKIIVNYYSHFLAHGEYAKRSFSHIAFNPYVEEKQSYRNNHNVKLTDQQINLVFSKYFKFMERFANKHAWFYANFLDKVFPAQEIEFRFKINKTQK
ncbi:methyltransferase domain-containing protein [Candidatus Woesearchaeota archaeon]|nr:methyltransferase domain-containing protein [Candidatus Woesearchaeota archaeon]